MSPAKCAGGAGESVEKPWTEKHVNEAKAALFRLAAEAIAKGDALKAMMAKSLADGIADVTASEVNLAAELRHILALDASVVAKILRTVRARAEGREVVTVKKFYRLRLPSGCYTPRNDMDMSDTDPDTAARFDDLGSAETEAKCWHNVRIVPVTLTRRRIVRAKDPS